MPTELHIFLATPHGLGKWQYCSFSLDACLANLHVFEVPAPFPTGVFVRIDAQDRPELHSVLLVSATCHCKFGRASMKFRRLFAQYR